jgi:hypothetical protein
MEKINSIMKQSAVEFLLEKITLKELDNETYLYPAISIENVEQAKEIEKQQQGYSEEEAMEFFIDGYKQRAELSNLIFDNASRMFAIALFKQFKNK